MTVLREDFLDQTYWRIFLKARYQDGSQGEPLHWNVWDLIARLSGDPQFYDEGGRLSAQVPPGYWVDMTSIANSYGWERLPALQNWKSFFPAALLGEFVYRQNLDWESAMLELYPAEALITSTPISYPLITPTLVPTWFRTRTLTPPPLPTITPTRRPTWTPLP
jgi:TolB protein